MSGRIWEQSELEYLHRNLGVMGIKRIARELNRTEKAVIGMAYKQGIKEKLNPSDAMFRKAVKDNNAIHRRTYQQRKDEGLCVRCGKRWAEAGRTKCRPCRERDQKWNRDNNMREYLREYNRQKKADRRQNHLCVNCGKPLLPSEIGINSQCARCRKKDMERITVKRIQMRVHGIKRKS